MEITGIERVQAKLNALGNKAKKDDGKGVTVGYSQYYAIFVHENLEAHHAEGKQAKYLEEPARTLGPELGKIAEKVYKETGSVTDGLLVAGLRLLRASQEIVPIDTGALRASGYVALSNKEEQAATDAFNYSENIRISELEARAKKK